MTSHRRQPLPTPWRTLLRRALAVTAVAGALATGSALVANPATANPSGTVRRGVGASIARGTDYVGQYRSVIAGHVVFLYCVNPNRRQPGRLSLSTVRAVPGLGVTTTREMAEVLAAHGWTSRLAEAEATSQALNYLAGNRADVTRRARYIPRSTQQLAMSYVAEARRLRGGSVLRLHLPAAPLPGRSARGTVTVTTGGGGKATTVALTHSGNVTTPARVRTDRRGVGSFTYRTTGTGPVRVSATATHLAPVTLRASSPAAGYQRMVAASGPLTAHASAAYQARGAGFGNSYACSSQCAGRPTVTLRACAPAGGYAARLTYTWPGGSKALDFGASTRAACRSVVVQLRDGVRVTGSWRFRGPHGWTTPVSAPGTFVVDCPAAPPVAVATSFDCTAASLTAALGRQRGGAIVPGRNATRHPMVLVVSGGLTGRFVLAPGAAATTHTWALSCGRHATVTVRSGVQRGNGAWNYGAPATVTLP